MREYRAGDPLPAYAYRLWMAFMDHCKGPEDEQKPGKPCRTCKGTRGPNALCPEGRRRFALLPKYLRETMLKREDVVTKLARLAPCGPRRPGDPIESPSQSTYTGWGEGT